jgi:poly-gamma-glutamate capsule biosynthesis protein CapA/YwtB (metallophosphatase superfamily)
LWAAFTPDNADFAGFGADRLETARSSGDDERLIKRRSQNPLALLCDLAVQRVLSAVTRLARGASLSFVSGFKSNSWEKLHA